MTHYLTKQGLADLQAELKNIVDVKIPHAFLALNTARAEGDLRENSAYDSAKEEVAKLEIRRTEVEEILADYQIIDEKSKTAPSKRVEIGGEVEIEYLNTPDKKNFVLKIVGSSEADVINSKISNESPLAQAILGKKEGEEVAFRVKREQMKVKIVKIIA